MFLAVITVCKVNITTLAGLHSKIWDNYIAKKGTLHFRVDVTFKLNKNG